MKSYSIYAGSQINHRMISEAIQLDRISYDDIYQLQVETCYAVSDVGVHLLSELGFAFVKPSMHESKIMALELFKKNEVQTKFNDRLLAVYKKYSEKEGRSNVI